MSWRREAKENPISILENPNNVDDDDDDNAVLEILSDIQSAGHFL